MVAGNAVFVNCTGDLTVVFLYSILQTAAGFSCIEEGCNFLLGRTICTLCFVLVLMEFYLKGAQGKIKGWFRSFEDDLYTVC